MDLTLTLFLLVLASEAISWIGKAVLQDFVFSIYQRVFDSARVSQQRQLKADILATKAELLQTSSQDQFAKWAKLRRKVDKGLADLEKLNGELVSTKGSFGLSFNTFLWILTTGAQTVLGFWYGRKAVFYLPPGWMGPTTWFLAFPLAPAGSVSCAAWQFVCKRVIKTVERVVKDLASGEADKSQEPASAEKVAVSQ